MFTTFHISVKCNKTVIAMLFMFNTLMTLSSMYIETNARKALTRDRTDHVMAGVTYLQFQFRSAFRIFPPRGTLSHAHAQRTTENAHRLVAGRRR